MKNSLRGDFMNWSEIFDKYSKHRYSHTKEKIIRGYFLCTILDLDLENIPCELTYEKCLYYDPEGKEYGNLNFEKVHIKDIVGTSYREYAGGTWLDSFCQLHRISGYIECNSLTYTKYFHHMKDAGKPFHLAVRLVKTKDGKYYVCENGNHRVSIYKLMYFANMYHRSVQTYDIYNPEIFWLYAYVKEEI